VRDVLRQPGEEVVQEARAETGPIGAVVTAAFDDRPEQYRPGPDARLNDPAHVADAVMVALTQPAGCEIRELVVAGSTETSWP